MTVQPSSIPLSQPAFATLTNILDDVQSPLGVLSNRLWESPVASHLSLGATIAALLQNDLLPEPSQRLIAIYILYDMIVSRHSLTPTSNVPTSSEESQAQSSNDQPTSVPAVNRLIESPLSIILFELADDAGERLPELLLFLSHLLTHSQTTNPSEAPISAQISQAPAVTLWNALESAMRSGAAVPKLNITSLRTLWNSHHPDSPFPNPSTKSSNVPNTHQTLPPVSGIVPYPDLQELEDASLSDELGSTVTLEDFVPPFVRIPPPLIPLSTDSRELRWIDPEPLHDLVWDPDMGRQGERGTELREIIAKAFKSPIPEKLQNQIVAQLNDDPKLIHMCGLTPQKLPDLIQNNSELATKLLLKLVNSKQMPSYLNALVNMDVNLHSMSIVLQISQAARLPSDFLHAYISNATRTCGLIPEKSAQARMVRCVCMFLNKLIKSKTVDMHLLHVEVQAFCIEYSKFRDVADLFLLLKNYGAP